MKFIKEPLKEKNGVLYFSNSDFYTDNYEKISADHIGHFTKTDSNPFIEETLWKESEDTTIEEIQKHIKAGDKILDVGVGLGRLLERITLPVEKHGIDISEGYLQYAVEKGIKCYYSKIEDMPFHDEEFDVVICTDVLEHVFDLYYCVGQITRVLKKGGIMIVRVPYREDLSGYLSPTYPYHYVHLRNFDENELQLLFTRIFDLEFLSWRTCGLWESPSRLPWGKIPTDSRKLKLAKYLLDTFLKKIKLKNPQYYKGLFTKVEIVTTLRKKSN